MLGSYIPTVQSQGYEREKYKMTDINRLTLGWKPSWTVQCKLKQAGNKMTLWD